MENLEEILQKKIEKAGKGREAWLGLVKQYHISDETYVILFPQCGTDCNRYVLKYLSAYAEKVKAKRLLLLTDDKEILENKDLQIDCEKVVWKREQAECLMAYYTLQMFTDKLIIAALDEPEGRNGQNIIGVRGVTEEEAVAVGILGLSEI